MTTASRKPAKRTAVRNGRRRRSRRRRKMPPRVRIPLAAPYPGIAKLGIAPGSGPGGRGFKSRCSDHDQIERSEDSVIFQTEQGTSQKTGKSPLLGPFSHAGLTPHGRTHPTKRLFRRVRPEEKHAARTLQQYCYNDIVATTISRQRCCNNHMLSHIRVWPNDQALGLGPS